MCSLEGFKLLSTHQKYLNFQIPVLNQHLKLIICLKVINSGSKSTKSKDVLLIYLIPLN